MSPSFAREPELALLEYRRRGYHIEPDLFDADECASVIERSKKLPSYVEGRFSSVMHPHRIDPFFLTMLASAKLVRIVERLIDGKASGLQTQYFYGPPGTLGYSLHQDNFFVEASPDAFVSAWLALEDVTPKNGGLIVYPGSHVEPVLPTREVHVAGSSPDPNANRVETVLPANYQPLDLEVRAGTVVFLHGNVIHASHRNSTPDRTRHVLLNTYIRQGEKFRAGAYSKREEVVLSPSP
jgi:ectoine hydroxylase-related dioxygenase (phytanoyl-CoA dioxygenase family)